MPILTLDNLDPGSFPYVNYTIFQSGRVAYYQKRAHVTTFDGQSITCQVNDEAGLHTVTLSAETKQQIHAYCDCGQTARGTICKHVVASLFAARDYIAQEAGGQWRYRLLQALESTPKEKTVRALRTRYAIVMGLQRERYADDSTHFRLAPFFIKSQKWQGLEELSRLPGQPERNIKLDKDRSWAPVVESAYRSLDARAVVNLPAEGVHLVNLMLSVGGYFANSTGFATYLPLMAKMDMPVFLMSSHNSFRTRLQLLSEPVKSGSGPGPGWAGLFLAGRGEPFRRNFFYHQEQPANCDRRASLGVGWTLPCPGGEPRGAQVFELFAPDDPCRR